MACRGAGYRNGYIVVRTAGTTEDVAYLHLDPSTIPAYLRPGTTVRQGEFLGRMTPSDGTKVVDACGTSIGTHLHLNVPTKPFVIDGYRFDHAYTQYGVELRSTQTATGTVTPPAIPTATAAPVPTPGAQPGAIVLETPTLRPTYYNGMCGSAWFRYVGSRGYYAYLTSNRLLGAPAPLIVNTATWRPTIAVAGRYKVAAFVPTHGAISWSCPWAPIPGDTPAAQYTVFHAKGSSVVIRDQRAAAGTWLDLGTYEFGAGTGAYVHLTDESPEPAFTRTISFSAMRFTRVAD
jgi:hypothetical protein